MLGRMDLLSFIERLKDCGQLLEVDAEIDGQLELAVLTNLLSKRGGPGLLFPQVKGTQIPLATNLFGSARRMAMALGYEQLTQLGNHLSASLAGLEGGSSAQRLRQLFQSVESPLSPPRCRPRECDLGFLPQLRYWPQEQRSFLTLAVVISRAPENDLQNYGLYRIGIEGTRCLTLNLLPGSGAGQHLNQWQLKAEKMPVAILLGADPTLLFAAAASLPGRCSEEGFSAFLNQRTLPVSACRSVSLHYPTSAQIVIEGWIRPGRSLNEGPFGCYTGDYGGSNNCPLVEISAVSMISEPLLPLTLAGPLPMEDCWIARANLELIRARLTVDLPQISRIEVPLEAAFHGLFCVRCSDPDLTVNQLAELMRGFDYLHRLKILILQRATDNICAAPDWRVRLKNLPSSQIWRAHRADLHLLSHPRPSHLQHDPQLVSSLLRRLNIAGLDI